MKLFDAARGHLVDAMAEKGGCGFRGAVGVGVVSKGRQSLLLVSGGFAHACPCAGRTHPTRSGSGRAVSPCP